MTRLAVALAFVLGLALGSRRPCPAWTYTPSESELTPEHRARLGRIFGWAESGDWSTDSYTEGLVRP